MADEQAVDTRAPEEEGVGEELNLGRGRPSDADDARDGGSGDVSGTVEEDITNPNIHQGSGAAGDGAVAGGDSEPAPRRPGDGGSEAGVGHSGDDTGTTPGPFFLAGGDTESTTAGGPVDQIIGGDADGGPAIGAEVGASRAAGGGLSGHEAGGGEAAAATVTEAGGVG
ncbi:MAG: hypothetical protein IID53_06265, partial [Proteobacteria bacterium]|nr:hypothetical protein [Pseudomonadota bacterium]